MNFLDLFFTKMADFSAVWKVFDPNEYYKAVSSWSQLSNGAKIMVYTFMILEIGLRQIYHKIQIFTDFKSSVFFKVLRHQKLI